MVAAAVVTRKRWENPCPKTLARNISSGIRESGGLIKHNGIIYPKNQYFLENGTVYGCVCNVAKCARKCCPLGEKMNNRNCKATEDNQFNFKIFDKLKPLNKSGNFEIIFNSDCPFGRTVLFPNFSDPTGSENFFLQENGDLYLPFIENGQTMYPPHRYCIDTFFLEKFLNNELSALLCFDADGEKNLLLGSAGK